MSAGGCCEAAQGHWGKKGRLDRGSKMLDTINHLAHQRVEGRLEGGIMTLYTGFHHELQSNGHTMIPVNTFIHCPRPE